MNKLPAICKHSPEELQPLLDLAKQIGVEVKIAPLSLSVLSRRFLCNGRPCVIHYQNREYPSILELSGEYGPYVKFTTSVKELNLSISWHHNYFHPSLGLFCDYLHFSDRTVGHAYYHTLGETAAQIAARKNYTISFSDWPFGRNYQH